MPNNHTTWLGVPCRKMKPTKQHTPVIWECMLGTLYARNPQTGEIKYCDYRWEEAFAHAGLTVTADPGYNPPYTVDATPEQDARVAKATRSYFYPDGPSKGRTCLWLRKQG